MRILHDARVQDCRVEIEKLSLEHIRCSGADRRRWTDRRRNLRRSSRVGVNSTPRAQAGNCATAHSICGARDIAGVHELLQQHAQITFLDRQLAAGLLNVGERQRDFLDFVCTGQRIIRMQFAPPSGDPLLMPEQTKFAVEAAIVKEAPSTEGRLAFHFRSLIWRALSLSKYS